MELINDFKNVCRCVSLGAALGKLIVLIGGSVLCCGLAVGEERDVRTFFWSHDEAAKAIKPLAQLAQQDTDDEPADADTPNQEEDGAEAVPQRLETRPPDDRWRPDEDRGRDRFRDDGVTIEALFRAAFEPYSRLPAEPMRRDDDDDEMYQDEQIVLPAYAPSWCTACPAAKERLQATSELKLDWLRSEVPWDIQQKFGSRITYPLVMDPKTRYFYCFNRANGDDPLKSMDNLIDLVHRDRSKAGLMQARRTEFLRVGRCRLESIAIESGQLRFRNQPRTFDIGDFNIRIPANFVIRGTTIGDACKIDFPEKRPSIKRRGLMFFRWPINSIQDRREDVIFRLAGGPYYVWGRDQDRDRDDDRWGAEPE